MAMPREVERRLGTAVNAVEGLVGFVCARRSYPPCVCTLWHMQREAQDHKRKTAPTGEYFGARAILTWFAAA